MGQLAAACPMAALWINPSGVRSDAIETGCPYEDGVKRGPARCPARGPMHRFGSTTRKIMGKPNRASWWSLLGSRWVFRFFLGVFPLFRRFALTMFIHTKSVCSDRIPVSSRQASGIRHGHPVEMALRRAVESGAGSDRRVWSWQICARNRSRGSWGSEGRRCRVPVARTRLPVSKDGQQADRGERKDRPASRPGRAIL